MMRAEQQSQQPQNATSSNPIVVVESSASDPTDDGSLPPKGLTLDLSFSAEDFGDKTAACVETATPVHDSGDDSTAIPKGATLNPMSASSEDLGIRNSDLDVTSEDDGSSTSYGSPAAKRLRLDPTSPETKCNVSSVQHENRTLNSTANALASSGGDTVIMVCIVTVRKADLVKLEMSWVDGQNRELMHQLLQFFKNRFV